MIHPGWDPVAFSLGPIAVRWYGLMYVLGFVAFFWLGKKRLCASRLPPSLLDDLLSWGVAGVLLGGRLGYVCFYQFRHYLGHPWEIFYLWHGGMSFHGGLLGVLAAMAWVARKHGLPFFAVADFVAPLVPPGLFFGRLGNFINGELWGKPSSLPWAIVFPQADSLPRHPSQLYEALLEGVVLFALLWWYSRKPRPVGAISGMFLVGYGAARFFVEHFREPDAFLGPLALGWSMGQWLSLPMILAGAVILWRTWKKPCLKIEEKAMTEAKK